MTTLRRPSPAGPLVLGFVVTGGIVAWILHLLVTYALVPVVCETGREYPLHVATFATALTAAAALGAAWRAHRHLGPATQEAEAPGDKRESALLRLRTQRFLTLAGILLNGFFLALILTEAIPFLLQEDPCRTVPTLDQPIIRRMLEVPVAARD